MIDATKFMTYVSSIEMNAQEARRAMASALILEHDPPTRKVRLADEPPDMTPETAEQMKGQLVGDAVTMARAAIAAADKLRPLLPKS